jgi:hypothetical protein
MNPRLATDVNAAKKTLITKRSSARMGLFMVAGYRPLRNTCSDKAAAFAIRAMTEDTESLN